MGNFSDLPLEMAVNILTHLPMESVLECKLVSKHWRNFVSDPSFSQMHLDRLKDLDSGKSTFLIYSTKSIYAEVADYFSIVEYLVGSDYTEYDENSGTCTKTSFTFRPDPDLVTDYCVLNSCNGLICFTACYDDNDYYHHQPVCVFNPLTKEYIMLQPMELPNECELLLSGFGYSHSTNEYKVVRMYKCSANEYKVEVYTLGSGNGWRDSGKLDFVIDWSSPTGLFANGALHWFYKNRIIVAFDLADEKFREFQRPLNLPEDADFGVDLLDLGVFGDSLCFTHRYWSTNVFSYDVWLLKKNSDTHDMDWSKEFSLAGYEPFAFTKSGDLLCCVEDEPFVGSHHKDICVYDPKASCCKMVVKFDRSVCNVILHQNTFASIKALGEKDTKMMKSGERARSSKEAENPAEKESGETKL